MCVKYSTTTSYSYRLLFSIVHLFGCRVLFCAPFLIFAARKRSLRRLCFYTCLSVILFAGGGGVCIRGGLHTGGSASRGVSIQGGWADPPPSDTTGYGQRAGGTQPTGMHSCYLCGHFLLPAFSRLSVAGWGGGAQV